MLIEKPETLDATTLDCEICVVGAGPAGITLALDLARSGRRVILIESGSREFDARAQSLGDAIVDETRHAPMGIATRRQWGGTSTIWGGRCLPLDPVDMEPRAARGDGVWPINYAEIARYHAEACNYALCGSPTFSAGQALAASASAIVPGFVDGAATATHLERWSLPTDFGSVYSEEVRNSTHLRAYLGLTCVGLEFSEPGHVVRLSARSVAHSTWRITAKQFVLAAGGLGSTRLLLNCDEYHPGGVGNHSGKLGHYYMGHISGKIAEVQFLTAARKTVFGFERDAEGVYCRRRFVISDSVQRDQGLLNCAMWLDNPPLPDAEHRNGILSMAYLALSMPLLSRYLAPEGIRRAAVESPRRSSVWLHLLNIVRDLPATVAFVPPFIYRRYFATRKIPGFFLFNRRNRYSLHYHGEQAPSHESRVRLGDALDELGMRRLEVDLRYSRADFESVIRSHEILDAHLRELGIGRLDYTDDNLMTAIERQARDGYHQIGTTRMSKRPEDGVVDENCRVHTVDNLYVLSSSVFPTSGQANPTLTIVALALRLAEHLRLRPSRD